MTEHQTPSDSAHAPRQRPPAVFSDYVAMARPDHWIKHVFVVPGILAAMVLAPPSEGYDLWRIVGGFLSAMAIASANYVINEWLDAEQDAQHPTKSTRPAACKAVQPHFIYLEYAVLAAIGLLIAWLIGPLFLIGSVAFLISGLIYNVPPLRVKDRLYLDSLIESVNNPIRMLLGWATISTVTAPPGSLLLAYWMGGAFLMTVKRYAEFREGSAKYGIEVLAEYRQSFARYTEQRLLLMSFLYGQLAAFFLGVFLIKYRIEYLLALPLLAILFTYYLRMALKGSDAAQAPEKLMREVPLLGLVALISVVLVVLSFVDIPALQYFMEPQLVGVH